MDVLCSCKSKNSNTKLQRQKRSRFSIDLWTHRVKLRAQMPHESKTSYDEMYVFALDYMIQFHHDFGREYSDY